jgi:hypothetical protein
MVNKKFWLGVLVMMLVFGMILLGSCDDLVEKSVTCSACDGTGKCQNCDGTGKKLFINCSVCSGTGKCQTCDGTGKSLK